MSRHDGRIGVAKDVPFRHVPYRGQPSDARMLSGRAAVTLDVGNSDDDHVSCSIPRRCSACCNESRHADWARLCMWGGSIAELVA
eukprot:6262786-Prymnesium_polylepis.1